MSFRMDNSELSKLFADAGAAVSKAHRTTRTPSESPSAHEPQTRPAAANPAAGAAKEQPKAEEERVPEQIAGGALDADGFNLTLKDGSAASFLFSAVRGLSAGRVGSEQLVGWRSGKRTFFVVYRDVNLKGMIPKMAASISENWKIFMRMMIEKCPPSKDQGLLIAKKDVGVLPAYPSREDFFKHIESI